ncbi:MAG: OmpH/Skp family outer membrane protein [Planctomycetota bacterium]
MTQASRIVTAPATLIAVLIAAALLLGPAYAGWLGPPAAPAIIGSVDLEKVFNEIDRRAEAETTLEALAEQFQQNREELRQVAEQKRMDMDLLAPGTDKYADAQDAWTQAVLEYRASVEFSKGKLDAKRAEARTRIYQEIVNEAARYAEANGIDFIVADDSGIDLMEGTDLQIVQQMSLRRLVYANPANDVTYDLITWINEL